MRFTATCFLVLSFFGLQAQFPYTLTSSNETYVPFDDGTDAAGFVWDDPDFNVPLGFDFLYFDQTVTSWYQIGLGAELSTSDDNAVTQSLFYPYTSDLIDTGELSGNHESVISYKTTGLAPNRVFHLQYAECGFYEEVTGNLETNNIVNFQVRLYEGSNDIAIHFGPNTIPDSELVHEGNPGPTIAFVPNVNFDSNSFSTFYLVGGAPASPEVSSHDPMDIYSLDSLDPLDGNPVDGTLYYFDTGMVGIAESWDVKLKLYPNPVATELNIEVPVELDQLAFEVTDLAGTLVWTGWLDRGIQTLDLSDFEDGVYLIRSRDPNFAFVHRFVKMM